MSTHAETMKSSRGAIEIGAHQKNGALEMGSTPKGGGGIFLGATRG